MNKSILTLAFGLILSLFAAQQAQATIRYVKPAASGDGSGSSWANASGDLQAMIDASGEGDEVWVAAGTYIPSRGLGELSDQSEGKTYALDNINNGQPLPPNTPIYNTFWLRDIKNVSIYGGFLGTETSIDQRQIDTDAESGLPTMRNKSILSGDETSYHVMILSFDLGDIVIDGFTITKGIANTSTALCYIYKNSSMHNIRNNGGAGIYVCLTGNATLTMNNLTIESNTASGSGGGICIPVSSNYIDGEVTLSNIICKNNSAASGGGICDESQTSTTITDSYFAENTASSQGSALLLDYTSNLDNVTVTRNVNNTSTYGGAVYLASSSTSTLNNMLISENTCSSGCIAPELFPI